MKASELKSLLQNGGLEKYSALYADVKQQTERFIGAIDEFCKAYGNDRDISILSVPGRSEIIGNHTDHNHGKVMAGAINRDIIAIASKNDSDLIGFCSEGYAKDKIALSSVMDADKFKKFTSRALIAGMAASFIKDGYTVGGFDMYCCTEVLKGSGLSSSAAFEVMIGNIINHLYCDGQVDNKEIAKYAQFSENVYFGKPCGLMDQMACAVGGFVYIDFADKDEPEVVPIDFALGERGYALCIINTGGNHADLNDDYASVPGEMKSVARAMGKDVLRGIDEGELIRNIPALRESVGDRAVLRALHFIRENERVKRARVALTEQRLDDFFSVVNESGASSFKYLQNVYTTANVSEQGLSLALALADGYLGGEGASRVHGGGFAGTVQVFVRKERLAGLIELMDSVFGEGAACAFNVRPSGAIRLDIK